MIPVTLGRIGIARIRELRLTETHLVAHLDLYDKEGSRLLSVENVTVPYSESISPLAKGLLVAAEQSVMLRLGAVVEGIAPPEESTPGAVPATRPLLVDQAGTEPVKAPENASLHSLLHGEEA